MPTPSYSTAQTIIDQSKAETGVGSNPISTALQTTAMLRVLHDCNHQFVNYPYLQGMLGWKFLLAETPITTYANTTANGAILSGATSLILTSATNFDSPGGTDIGAGYIKTGNTIYDFFTYESKSANTLSTVSGIQMAHATLEEVHKLYKLPADFGKVRNLWMRSNLYTYQYIDPDMTQIPRAGQFTIRNFTSTNNYSASFAIFREDIGALEFKMQYFKQPTTIDEVGDYVNAPDGTGRRYLIECLNAYIWTILGEQQEAVNSLARADSVIRQCMMEWAVQEVTPIRNVSLSSW